MRILCALSATAFLLASVPTPAPAGDYPFNVSEVIARAIQQIEDNCGADRKRLCGGIPVTKVEDYQQVIPCLKHRIAKTSPRCQALLKEDAKKESANSKK